MNIGFTAVLIFLFSMSFSSQYEKAGKLIDLAKQQKYWPEAPAVITESGVVDGTEPELLIFERVGHYVRVRYRFQVDGITYDSHYPWIGSEFLYSTRDMGHRSRLYRKMQVSQYIAQNLPVGKQVTARYNPANPQQAVIELSDTSALYSTHIIYLLLRYLVPLVFIGQVYFLFTGNKKSKRTR